MKENIDLDIIEEDILQYNKTLLDILLIDRTTEQNIIWATNDYEKFGEEYFAKKEINSELLIGTNIRIVQPRVAKEKAHQNIRTKEKAEVFTPSWACNVQNNLIDENWFGRTNVFNTSYDSTWIINKNKIVFPKSRNRTWKNYIEDKRMEITCGEAPYLVSRYDSTSGEIIELENRIGLLDRKLRIINENVDDEKNWFNWVRKAFQSVYAYEYHGDSLLLARENLLYTFIDNLEFKFGRKPVSEEIIEIANIISWNLWQMDGITYTVPLSDSSAHKRQLQLFDFSYEIPKQQFCKIMDWKTKSVIEYVSLIGGENEQ